MAIAVVQKTVVRKDMGVRVLQSAPPGRIKDVLKSRVGSYRSERVRVYARIYGALPE